MSAEEGARLAGIQPDYHTVQLYNDIEKGDYPVWICYLQIIPAKEAETYKWNIFDMTKTIPHKDYPLVAVGKLTLNKNVSLP